MRIVYHLSAGYATEDIRVYDEAVNDPDKSIFFVGQIRFETTVNVKGIFAGCGIEAGYGIKAGCGFCIFAGLRIRFPEWERHAIVTAKVRPVNLISGFWMPLENNTDEETI